MTGRVPYRKPRTFDVLRPCPFCGGKARLVSGCHEEGDAYAMVCCEHYAGLSDSCASVFAERSSKVAAEEDAVAMWNRREAI